MLSQITAGPKLYIGLDIHKKTWAVHFRTDICDQRGITMPADAEKLFNYGRHHFSDHQLFITYESGCCGFSTARYFIEEGWHVTVPYKTIRKEKKTFQMLYIGTPCWWLPFFVCYSMWS